ncbi:MAG: periplasmic heavy metal sensor [Planctomycetes bacterium]|nr:periplasmic heavy metal sensor [Planctomycetota bacterium]
MKSAWFGILLGALLASLAYNVVQHRRAEAERVAVDQILDDLDLSDQQVEQLSSYCAGCGCLEDGAREQLRAAEQELTLAISADPLDEAAVRQLTARVAELRREMFESCVDTILRVRGVLSAEQRSVLHGCCQDCR